MAAIGKRAHLAAAFQICRNVRISGKYVLSLLLNLVFNKVGMPPCTWSVSGIYGGVHCFLLNISDGLASSMGIIHLILFDMN